jgi:homoserine dehydrogenase
VIDFDTAGFESAFGDFLASVEDSVGESTLRTVGFAGAEIFRDEAKVNAARNAKTRNLYNNIIVKRVEEESDGNIRQVYIVRVRNGKRGPGAFYWRFVEYGHKFVPKNKNVSAKTGKTIGWAAHRRAAALEYGTASAPAYPFMRPAYSSKWTP